ncbi:MAG: hypothetical protein RLZZ30_2132, partial [Bacteroidota bacterium]
MQAPRIIAANQPALQTQPHWRKQLVTGSVENRVASARELFNGLFGCHSKRPRRHAQLPHPATEIEPCRFAKIASPLLRVSWPAQRLRLQFCVVPKIAPQNQRPSCLPQISSSRPVLLDCVIWANP